MRVVRQPQRIVRARLVVIGIAVAVLIGMGGSWLTGYRTSEFRGAGPIKDKGVFSYPRYQAPVGEFPFHREGTYEFRFSGVPAQKMALQLYVRGYSASNRADLESLTTKLSFEIRNASGAVVCSGHGTPATYAWRLASGLHEAAYWHPACADGRFARRAEYALSVSVQAPDPKTPKVELIAMLEGGGIELP
jgi:hypothetical protein